MNTLIDSVRGEYLRYKKLAEGAIAQLDDDELAARPDGRNSIIVICWHVSGNLRSRFTDFLTSDGEKPWRQREEEFADRAATRAELMAKWDEGWAVLLEALKQLTDDQLHAEVTIRGQGWEVHEALQRSLAHTAYHVGQIVYIAKSLRADKWKFLSIPPGQSDAYNQKPAMDRPSAHAAAVDAATARG
jgi:uncharacterized damage-inducible protein DinB